MPQLVDVPKMTPERHYQHVLAMDRKIRSLVSDMPSFLLRESQEDPQWPPCISWARVMLTLNAADKVSYLKLDLAGAH